MSSRDAASRVLPKGLGSTLEAASLAISCYQKEDGIENSLAKMQIEAWRPGASHVVLVTAPESKVSSEMFSRSGAHKLLLRPFWQVEAWRPGVSHVVLVTAPESKISSEMFSRSVAHKLLLLQSWEMEPW